MNSKMSHSELVLHLHSRPHFLPTKELRSVCSTWLWKKKTKEGRKEGEGGYKQEYQARECHTQITLPILISQVTRGTRQLLLAKFRHLNETFDFSFIFLFLCIFSSETIKFAFYFFLTSHSKLPFGNNF